MHNLTAAQKDTVAFYTSIGTVVIALITIILYLFINTPSALLVSRFIIFSCVAIDGLVSMLVGVFYYTVKYSMDRNKLRRVEGVNARLIGFIIFIIGVILLISYS